MRKTVAWGMALALGGLITVSSLIACPFVQAYWRKAAHSCCSERTNAPSSCPLSKSLETCPLYVAETKIGPAKSTVELESVVLAAAPIVLLITDPGSASLVRDHPVPETADLYLRYRVLRI
jgi:hypothetical protein